MLAVEEVKRLARLARLAVTNDEAAALGQDLERILAYVAQLDQAEVSGVRTEVPDLLPKNNLRPDGEPHPSGVYSADLLQQFSVARDGYLEVKPILSHD